jgi:hypothetical protein
MYTITEAEKNNCIYTYISLSRQTRQQDRQAFLPIFPVFSGISVVLAAVLAAQFGKTAAPRQR